MPISQTRRLRRRLVRPLTCAPPCASNRPFWPSSAATGEATAVSSWFNCKKSCRKSRSWATSSSPPARTSRTCRSKTRATLASPFPCCTTTTYPPRRRLASPGIRLTAVKRCTSGWKRRPANRTTCWPCPAVFVLDTEGVIQFEYVNPNHQVRVDSDVLLDALRAHQRRV